SKLLLSLTEFIKKHSNVFNTKQTCYQNIYNARFHETNLVLSMLLNFFINLVKLKRSLTRKKSRSDL
ncbi:Os12g0502600, partial [Oryza sativa Japonica Group]